MFIKSPVLCCGENITFNQVAKFTAPLHTTFIDLTQTTIVYRLAYMKKSGNRLSRCPDFVIHYSVLPEWPSNHVE
ncbi:hypothetical protein D9D45_25015 [Escherichia coli]|nr:hypothetical protein [Escherichia coli]RBJ01756.1 hypothetical protein DR106_22050 [Escherichia coli]